MKLVWKCVGRSKRLTQPKLNLEKQPGTSFSCSTHTHTPAPWAISAVGVVSVSVSTWSSFYLFRVVVIFVVVVVAVVVAIAVLRLLLLMGFRDPTTPGTQAVAQQKLTVITLFRQAVNKFNTKSMLWKQSSDQKTKNKKVNREWESKSGQLAAQGKLVKNNK